MRAVARPARGAATKAEAEATQARASASLGAEMARVWKRRAAVRCTSSWGSVNVEKRRLAAHAE